jgi:hypothetical protein
VKYLVILIIILKIQFLEATSDVDMILLNMNTHSSDLLLNGHHSIKNAGEHSIRGWRWWSSLGRGSCRRINLSWRRSYFLLILQTPLSIQF